MAILKDLIVHGSSRFLNKIYASEIQTPLIEADAGVFKKLKADDATIVGLLDVQGQLHTNSWTNSNIATIDGSFYITPTLSSSSGTVSFNSATAATFTGTYSAVSSLYVGNNTASTVQWTSGSKILITGEVQVDGEWTPLGTLLGTLNSTNPTTSMPIVSITDNKNNPSTVLADIYSLKSNTSLTYRNLKVSLYQRADNSEYYPLGIFMTALGQNGKTFLDIYGGVNALTTSYGGYADPNVRIGNLSGLPAITTAAGNFSPVGWGIYTTNGYFSGTVVSSTGVIGGWRIGASSLYNGTTGLNNNTAGIYLGTNGIRNYKDSNTYVNITEGVITAKGVNLTGQITATSGTIAGWTIKQNYLITGNNSGPGANILMLNGNGTTGSYTIAGIASTGWMITAGTTFGINKNGGVYATSGKIGGWTIGTSSLYNNKSSYNNSNEGLYLGTDYIAGGAGEEWWLNKDGSAKIGEMTLTKEGVLSVPAARISGQLTAATIDASRIDTGDISSDRITTNVLTALQAKLTSLNTNNLSAITANLGTITTGVIKHDIVGGTNGIWFSADTDTSSNVTIGSSTARKDWRLLVNNKFGVTKEGNLYASNVDLTGKITATSGTIGGINIINGDLDVSSISIGSLNGASNYAQKTDISDAINNIDVGGRNLIVNTLYPSAVGSNLKRPHIKGQTANTSGRGTCTVAEHGIRFTTTSANWQYIYFGNSSNSATPDMLGLEAGETYTLSADLFWKILSSDTGKENTTTYYMGAFLNYSTSSNLNSWSNAVPHNQQFPITQVDKGTDMSGRLVFTFTVPSTAARLYLGIRADNTTASHYAVGDYIEARNLKLEKGNKATDWTPAPEDLTNNIDENTGWNVILNISTIDYSANTAILNATVYKDGSVQTSGFTLQWYKTVTSTGITPETTTTTIISGETTSALSVTDLDASYTCVVN